jgi:hypothetical protein
LKHVAISLILVGMICIYGCGDSGGSAGPGPSNHTPVIEAQADTSLVLGDTLVIWAEAHDEDGDELAYTAAAYISFEELIRGYSPDAGMNAASGRFEFRTRDEDGPRRRFTFSVDDGRGGADSTTFWVNIN